MKIGNLFNKIKDTYSKILLITRLVQMVERKPSKFEVTGSSPVFCARVNGVLIYGVISVVVAREFVAL